MKVAFDGRKSLAATVTLSVTADRSTSSPNCALLLSITTFTAIDAPTAVLSPLDEPQLPGSSQVASLASAMAQALVTILLVAVETTPTLAADEMVVLLRMRANCLS